MTTLVSSRAKRLGKPMGGRGQTDCSVRTAKQPWLHAVHEGQSLITFRRIADEPRLDKRN
jgi:hypothetical protein